LKPALISQGVGIGRNQVWPSEDQGLHIGPGRQRRQGAPEDAASDNHEAEASGHWT
jgi:hypothetical protein